MGKMMKLGFDLLVGLGQVDFGGCVGGFLVGGFVCGFLLVDLFRCLF